MPNPDPSKAVKLLCDIVDELREDPYDWQAQRIHLFGFAQGGTLAVETALRYGRARGTEQLASVVSIQGPLLSLPSKAEAALNTKVLYVYRSRTAAPSAKVKADVAALERGFSRFKSLRLPEISNGPIGMPNSKQEWEGIMAFWSEQLQSTSAWQRQGEVYEVTGGQSAVKLPEKSGMAQPRENTNTPGAENTIEPPAKSSTSSVATDTSTPKAKPQAPSGLKRGFLSRGL